MFHDRNQLLAALLVGLFLGSAGGSAVAAGGVLTIEGDRFLYDGEPFEMWGIRTASGTMDDDQCEHLIAQFDDYLAHGVNTVTVFTMGCRGGNYDPFAPDGSRIDPGHQERMERIIQAAAERGMVVVVGIFYQHAPFGLESADAVRKATRVVTESLKPFRNVIINICNEQNSPGWRTSADASPNCRDTARKTRLAIPRAGRSSNAKRGPTTGPTIPLPRSARRTILVHARSTVGARPICATGNAVMEVLSS